MHGMHRWHSSPDKEVMALLGPVTWWHMQSRPIFWLHTKIIHISQIMSIKNSVQTCHYFAWYSLSIQVEDYCLNAQKSSLEHQYPGPWTSRNRTLNSWPFLGCVWFGRHSCCPQGIHCIILLLMAYTVLYWGVTKKSQLIIWLSIW